MVVGGVPIEIVRKRIKNLHVGVYPPAGRVRIAAPLHLKDQAVRLAVTSRLGWIRRRQSEFQEQDRQSQRELVTGESHYFLGRRYRLNVIQSQARPRVLLKNNKVMELRVKAGSDWDVRDRVLQGWYRAQLREQVRDLLGKWEHRATMTVREVRIKKMKTLWGSCNASAKRIWLNLELAKKPTACLEYILVHEMVHFKERLHSERFVELMDDLMPTWRQRREKLNRAPLAHEYWAY